MTVFGREALEFVRGRVVHVVGHELRTPLTTARGLAELLDGASDDTVVARLVLPPAR
jgi:signal transduction histidine kinase